MRQIKFKYYFNTDNDKNTFAKTATLEQIEFNTAFNGIVGWGNCKAKMQFTGFLDINGVEIYEGDIVKWGHLPNNTEYNHRVAIVNLSPSLGFRVMNYIDGRTLEQLPGDNHFFGFSNFIYTNTHEALEVLGNIYQNKDLFPDGYHYAL